MKPPGTILRIYDLSRAHIVSVTGLEEVESPRFSKNPLVVIDRDIARPNNLQLIPTNDNRRALIYSNAQKLRMCLNDLDHVKVAIAGQMMLVN